MTLFFVQATDNVGPYWEEEVEYEQLFLSREAAEKWAESLVDYEMVRIVEEEVG